MLQTVVQPRMGDARGLFQRLQRGNPEATFAECVSVLLVLLVDVLICSLLTYSEGLICTIPVIIEWWYSSRGFFAASNDDDVLHSAEKSTGAWCNEGKRGYKECIRDPNYGQPEAKKLAQLHKAPSTKYRWETQFWIDQYGPSFSLLLNGVILHRHAMIHCA